MYLCFFVYLVGGAVQIHSQVEDVMVKDLKAYNQSDQKGNIFSHIQGDVSDAIFKMDFHVERIYNPKCFLSLPSHLLRFLFNPGVRISEKFWICECYSKF